MSATIARLMPGFLKNEKGLMAVTMTRHTRIVPKRKRGEILLEPGLMYP